MGNGISGLFCGLIVVNQLCGNFTTALFLGVTVNAVNSILDQDEDSEE